MKGDTGIVNHRPRKRFSQNFLVDRGAAQRIVSLAEIEEGDRVIEVGPGRGVLTRLLLDAGARVTSIEIDTALSEGLRRYFGEREGFELITKDALKFSFLDYSKKSGERFKLVSNLPYNISGPMLAKLINERAALSVMVLMFQKEVGERITAAPDTKEYGSLSVLAQTFANVTAEFDLPPGAFRPAPKVNSTVLKLRVLDAPRVEVPDYALYKRIVRGAFAHRRKTLPNTLKGLGFERGEVLAALEAAGIDPGRRGETLDLEEFSKLTLAFHAIPH